MSAPTTVAALRRMLDDLPDYYEISVLVDFPLPPLGWDDDPDVELYAPILEARQGAHGHALIVVDMRAAG